MNFRLLLSIIVFLLGIEHVQAQDSLKHTGKHIHKKHITDSSNASARSHLSVKKDTIRGHRQIPVIMPKYPRTGYVAIMGGLGLPLAAYASDQGAATGSVFSLSAAFPGIISHGGIAFKFDYGINGFNKARLEGIENTVSGFSNINCTVSDSLGHCSYSTFLGGLYLTYPKKYLTIDFRMLAGVMLSRIPEIDIVYNDETRNNTGVNKQAATSGAAFAIDLGFEFRYPVKTRFCIILSGDYLHAVPSFTMVNSGSQLSSYGSIEDNSAGTETTRSQPFNLFNFSLGVGYTISAQKQSTPKMN